MNYTEKQVEKILENVWNDRIKGGGWTDKKTFIDKMKVVKKLTIPVVGVRSEQLFCDCYIKYPRGSGKCNRCGLHKE